MIGRGTGRLSEQSHQWNISFYWFCDHIGQQSVCLPHFSLCTGLSAPTFGRSGSALVNVQRGKRQHVQANQVNNTEGENRAMTGGQEKHQAHRLYRSRGDCVG